QGNHATVATLVGRVVAAQPNAKFLIAALDDVTALAAKSALEGAGRVADGAIVSFGCDRSIHGGASDRKEIDPSNRGSIVLGSVAFYLDRAEDDASAVAGIDLLAEASSSALSPSISTVTVTMCCRSRFACSAAR